MFKTSSQYFSNKDDALKSVQRILTQGHFDGLCLIYSLFNGYKALRNPSGKASNFASKKSNFWRRVIGSTPSLHNFVQGEGSDFGRLSNSTDTKVKRTFITTCFEVMTDGSAVSPVITITDVEFLATMDFSESVVILCVKKKAKFEGGEIGGHWIAIVGRDDASGVYFVACSYASHLYGFNERQDPKTGRFYNTTIKISGISKSTSYPGNINVIQLVPRT